MRRFLAAFVLLVSTLTAAPWAPSSDRMPPSWEPHRSDSTGTGIPGGIPSRSGGTLRNVVTSYSADNTGATDASGAIGTALAASSSGDVVYLPAGTYRIDSSIRIPSGITVRGAGTGEPGEGLTLLDTRSTEAFVLGSDDTWTATETTAVSASLTKGATSIQVSSSAGFTSGRFAKIRIPNSTSASLPVFKADEDLSYIREFIVYVSAVPDGTHLTIYPQLHADFSSYSSVKVVPGSVSVVSGVGVEDLYITHENNPNTSSRGVNWTSGVKESWLKNVKITGQRRYGIFATDSIRCEFDKVRIGPSVEGGGSNHSGVLLQAMNGLLMWNCIVTENAPNIEINFGTVASAFLYNYIDSDLEGQTFVINHGPWNSHNLVEGNYLSGVIDDGYFGGSSENTFFRNWVSSLSADPDGGDPEIVGGFFLNRFARNHNIVGNIFRAPGYVWGSDGIFLGAPYGGATLTPGVAPSLGTYWGDFDSATGKPKGFTVTLTSKANDYNGVVTISNTTIADAFEARLVDSDGGSYPRLRTGFGQKWIQYGSRSGNTWTVSSNSSGTSGAPLGTVGDTSTSYAGPGGFRELDLDVANTAVQYQNYTFNTGDIITGQTLPGGTTLGESLVGFTSSSKPASFTTANLTFPPFDPDAAASASIANIPAGTRALQTVEPRVLAAQWNPPGNALTVIVNKPVSDAGGTDGFAVSASGVTLTYVSTSGSNIIFTPSRAIIAGEIIDLSYTSSVGRWEDVDGNDLLSKSAFHITNLSTNNPGKVVFWSVNPDDAVSTAYAMAGPGTSRIMPIVVSVAGIADAIAIPIVTKPYDGNLKIGVYDASLNLVVSITEAVGSAGETQYFGTSFAATPQTYYVAIQSAQNDSPTIKKLDGGAGAAKEEYTTYASFPPSSVTLSGSFGYDLSIGIRVAPNTSATVTNTTVTGSLNLP